VSTAVLFGVYINLITNALQQVSLLAAIAQAGWSNGWAVAGLATVLLQLWLPRIDKLSRKEKYEIVRAILELSARAIVYPRPVEQVDIRAFCHLADPQNEELKPFCRWSLGYTTDSGTHIPYTGEAAKQFLIAQAFNTKEILAENLPINGTRNLPRRLVNRIKPNLRCVLAAPLRNFDDDAFESIGTVSFDSSKSLREIGFDKQGAKDIAKLVAECIFLLLRE
jgi:hypothetical protein